MNNFVKMALETAIEITGKDGKDEETQKIAFELACVMMADELANN